MSEKYPHLFSPLRINGMELRNRINFAPMVSNYATSRGEVTDRLIAYYAARAHGGAGLISVEATVVSANGRSFHHNLCIYDDLYIPGLKRLTEAVHAGGAKVTTEIYHAGRRTSAAVARSQPVAPSALPPKGGETPRELTLAEIAAIQDDFVAAGRRAKEAGFDAITLHAAHGYLIGAFLSPLANQRQDRYGGDLANRARFGLEISERLRAELGPDFPIICRLSGSEFMPGGFTLEDMQAVAPWYEAAGVDAFDVSAGTIETHFVTSHYMMFERGLLLPLARGIKESATKPVFAVGRIVTAEMAEEVIASGTADAVTMGRGLIADHDLPIKAKEGRESEIIPCIACNQGCLDRVAVQTEIACLVNPQTGREQYASVCASPTPGKVVVVGGGLAGMECAWVAKQRGHEVILLERGDRLGGQFILAGASPGKGEIHRIIDFLIDRVHQSGVDVRFHTEATVESLAALKPDVVVLAAGAKPLVIPVPGAEHAVLSWDILSGKVQAGPRTVVVGGGQVGCETAEYIAHREGQVTVLEMLPEIAADMSPRTREPFMNHLIAMGIDFIPRAQVTALGEHEVYFERYGLPQQMSGIDTIVMAVGSRADRSLAEALAGQPYRVIEAGDVIRSRRGLEAIHEGYAAGCQC